MKRDKKQSFGHMEIIESLLHQIEGKDAQINVLVDEVKSLEKTVSRLSDEIATLRRALYGTSSERSVAISNEEITKKF